MSEKPFETEAALCAAFIADLEKGWTAYPETAGWDILLVRDGDGFQVGVEAKLRLNAKVICQALEGGPWSVDLPGPDCRAVLVPEGVGRHYDQICAYIGLTVITMRRLKPGRYLHPAYTPNLPRENDSYFTGKSWREWCPTERCPLPDYIPDVAAGASAPIQLTDWKIKAIKIAVLLGKRGYVTRADFKALRLDIRRWLPNSCAWLVVTDGGFVAGPYFPDFRSQHPEVYGQIEADAEDWMQEAGLIADQGNHEKQEHLSI
ncbi:hypothetical protein HW532_15835 [Kaustia mangrovi]|uniref:Uncharacterized protein n=1 Tax=Kaustia mangrovi TaxID=2593653 RepID=A0A7S8C611_9HYPH|nr:hypothetical protein [Kaustia mangrovi]QPC44033.1 hypothetical protein HW532_15835 [Kaustia mangrovi]